MDDENSELKWWERLLRLWWLGTITAGCFLVVSLCPDLPGGIPIILSTVGSSALVVWLLAGTVDWWLKKAILKDVFKAAVGHLLPPELKPEMEWVYRLNVLAIEHTQTCQIKNFKDNLVIMRVKINRTFRNISQKEAPVNIGLGIDEWFHSQGQSKIIDFGYRIGAIPKALRNGDFQVTHEHSYTWDIKFHEIMLEPKSELEMWLEYEEVKHSNDEGNISFGYATKSPLVSLTLDDGLDGRVKFGHREEEKPLGQNQFRLKGTLLPGQPIRIRWWRINDSEKQQQAIDKREETKTT